MKKILLFIALLSATLVLTTSCDKVEPGCNGGDGSVPTSDTIRKLLFEDYTGHLCTNCPSAHIIIDDLHKIYGDRMVTVAIHSFFFATTSVPPYDTDFTSADGTAIATSFGVGNSTPLPKGVVNRAKVNGSYLIERGEFSSEVAKVLMDKMPDLYLEIKPNYSGGNTFDVEVKITAMKDMPAGKYNLSVLITESDIIAAQKNVDPNINNGHEILDYHHNHVLRAAVNTTFGEEFASSISNGQTFTKSYTNVPLDAAWDVDNISIVAFAYYADGAKEKEVIQAQVNKLK